MTKFILIMSFTAFLCKPLFDSSPFGIGGPARTLPELTPKGDAEFDVEENDTMKADQLIASELSLEKAREELLKTKTVEIIKPDIWPVVGLVTSDYGWRRIGKFKEFHPGIDISAPYGTPVSVASDGRVIYAGRVGGYGQTVIVYHGYGFVTLYGHLSQILVNRGEEVVKGQIIGKVGMTGRTTGPHLHYEVIKYGFRQNPIAYLP
ncbi:MAG: M23 family metallopeptidase [Aquificaceae bacterium]